jgi:hypothetical protein
MTHDLATKYLEHYGKKGMKWGVRKSRTRREMAVINSRKNIRKNRKFISDKDLDQYITRLQNEKKLKDLLDDDLAPGKTASKRILGESGQKVAKTLVAGGALLAVKVAVNKKFGGSAGTDLARGKIK